jgi:hypothetical protein
LEASRKGGEGGDAVEGVGAWATPSAQRTGKGGDVRMLAPEVTLEQMAGGDGEGFLKLINALLVEGSTEDGEWSVFVRHEAFERKFLFKFDQDTILPASKVLRGFQYEQVLT